MANNIKLIKKDILILKILNDNPEGLRKETIRKLSSLKERTIYNHLKSLREKKIIENIYPIWKIAKSFSESENMAKLLSNNKIQLHDLSFIIRLINKPEWWDKRANRMMKLKEFKIKNVDFGNNPYNQLINDSFVIQIHNNSIIVMNKKKYYGNDSYDLFIKGMNDFLEIYKYLEEVLKFKFFNDGIPQVSVRSSHFVKIGDEIARRCRKKGDLLEVKINGKIRALVDMSDPKGLEFVNKDYNVEDTSLYKKYVSDILINNPPTNSQLAIHIQNVTNNQLIFAENMKSHIEAIKELGSSVKKLTRTFKRTQQENKKLKLGTQSTLNEF